MEKSRKPSEELSSFLNFVDDCIREYHWACDVVMEEDRRLQDLLHALEFSEDEAEKNRVATKLRRSRRTRRSCKDLAKRDELVVKFFENQEHQKTLNQLRQLLGRQRKEESYLEGERTYTPRVQ